MTGFSITIPVIPFYENAMELPIDGSVILAYVGTDPFGRKFQMSAIKPREQPGTPWHGLPEDIGLIDVDRLLFTFNGSGHHHSVFSRLVSDGIYEYRFLPLGWQPVSGSF